jgi:hypothetical protein
MAHGSLHVPGFQALCARLRPLYARIVKEQPDLLE